MDYQISIYCLCFIGGLAYFAISECFGSKSDDKRQQKSNIINCNKVCQKEEVEKLRQLRVANYENKIKHEEKMSDEEVEKSKQIRIANYEKKIKYEEELSKQIKLNKTKKEKEKEKSNSKNEYHFDKFRKMLD